MIPISKPYTPPMEELQPYLEKIWASGVMTNNGPLVQELEHRLRQYTGVKHAFLVSSGTVALQLAMRALDIRGSILTTPFSMLATLSSILWEQFEPGFADIDPDTLNISPEEIEKKISDKTGCILATHVYGNSCDVARLEAIARRRNIPLIFDAAHAFGTTYRGRDIMSYGTVSALSLQAFKILHSAEGGVIFTNDDAIAEKIFRMRYFGYDRNMEVQSIGLNGKTSELNAALGLCVFDHFDEVKESRQRQSLYYDQLIANHNIRAKRPHVTPDSKFNFAYYALVFETMEETLKILHAFDANGIQFKRYFHPSLNTVKLLKKYETMPVSESISSRVICLPLYHSLTRQEQDLVISSMSSALKH